ncbi:hypothetical protein BRARA_F03369 [Brassica rapa]|uniref:Uncharacterized protein n=1 Tax=Brassica campestris TaxID=3711 RepID=A0A397Z3B5_BRACM|nr:hypothetical protein BRARA_F03369 [Brassica rapa]
METNPANGLAQEKGSAAFLIELEKQRAIKVTGRSTTIGLAITFFAGICFSLFSPAFNLATNDQWHTLKHGVPKLNVYTAFFYFSVSAFMSALILNIKFLYWPILGLPRSSFKAYLNDWNGRGWSLLAGLLCGIGNGLQFMGGQTAGYAAAGAVQVLTSTSTCEHFLGDNAVWRIQEIIEKNIYTSYQYALHVHRCSRGSYDLIRT